MKKERNKNKEGEEQRRQQGKDWETIWRRRILNTPRPYSQHIRATDIVQLFKINSTRAANNLVDGLYVTRINLDFPKRPALALDICL